MMSSVEERPQGFEDHNKYTDRNMTANLKSEFRIRPKSRISVERMSEMKESRSKRKESVMSEKASINE